MPVSVHRRPRPSRPSRPSLAGWRPGESRGVWIGVGGTLLAHVALWWLVPRLMVPDDPAAGEGNRSFLIELTSDAGDAPAVEPAPPDRFVEVNPDAPENMPDETRNFGAQDQQLAQPEPSPETATDAEAPAMTGEDEQFGAAIVSGQSAPRALPVVPAPPPAPASPEEAADQSQADATARLEEIARPGLEVVVGDNPDGLATGEGNRPGADARSVEGGAEGRPDGYALLSGRVFIDPGKPQARRTLPVEASGGAARSAPVLKNRIGTKNIGAFAYDARWSDYGAYLQKLIETVQAQWERQIIGSRVYPVFGTKIAVTFILDRGGAIERIVKVEGPDDLTAKHLCVSAITARAPYGEWSEDMVAVLGESQELTFRFHYQ